ncbi:hypothetical protein [Paenibacillus sp. S150]|uniref:hypothetical protein n=1 Tax=Paenibacillus sp. S150 TaxID=2749826 RepID=UPI001C56D349|nr:hypothetical protein [Paenibacillus sp. S150]MBW4083747.1 hypothetical protein [Paenibacillus sp. S150]
MAIFGQNLGAFTGGSIGWYGILVSYVSLPLFLLTRIFYRWFRKSSIVPLDQCDLSTHAD